MITFNLQNKMGVWHPVSFSLFQYYWSRFQDMLYIVLVIVGCMIGEHYCESNGINFIQGGHDVHLNCIDVTSRSVIDCALKAHHMEHYEDRFAYRNGKCHVCRADDENCFVSPDEYLQAGPHFVKGRTLNIMWQEGIFMKQNAETLFVVAYDT